YRCAQSEKKVKSRKGVREGAKMRDKGCMDTFACKGWLNITVYEELSVVDIKLSHAEEHIPYWCIDIPQNVCQFVKNNCQLTSAQV
ncbi:hypothetical protein B0H34DRAFT_631400, partial [Crassisporium funariophilum]